MAGEASLLSVVEAFGGLDVAEVLEASGSPSARMEQPGKSYKGERDDAGVLPRVAAEVGI